MSAVRRVRMAGWRLPGRNWPRVVRRLFSGRLAWFTLGVLALLAALSLTELIYPAKPREASNPSRRAELVILTGADDSTGGQRQRLVEEWNRSNPDNPARLEALSAVADEQHSEMVGRAQSGASGVDVYNLDVTWTAEFAAANYIRPLDGTASTEGFLDAPLETCRFDGKLWALPFNTDAGLLYYRTDVVGVTKAPLPPQLPPSEADITAMVGVKPNIEAGFVTQLDTYEGLTVNALEAIWAAHGDVVDGAGTVVIDRQPALQGLRNLARGLKKAGNLPPAISPASKTYKEAGSTAAFQRGEVALLRNWPVAYGRLKSQPPVGGFEVAPLPGPSVLGGQNLAIARDTANPRMAQKLIEFLTNDANERTLFREGGLAATRTDAYDDPKVQRAQPYAQTLLLTLAKSARQRPATPHYALFSSVFQDIVSYALNHDGALPERAVARLTDALQGRLG